MKLKSKMYMQEEETTGSVAAVNNCCQQITGYL